jgi:hypothetical protein
MSTRTYTYTFTGNDTITAPGGRFFFIKSASALLNINTRGSTTAPIQFVGVGAGLKFGPVPLELAWRYLDVYSSTNQTIEIIVSDEAEVDVANTVNVAGNVTTTEMPCITIATPTRTSVGSGAQVLVVAANLNRRRVTFQAPQANTDIITMGPTGDCSATRGVEVPPGATFGPIPTLAAFYAIAVSGTQSLQVFEET